MRVSINMHVAGNNKSKQAWKKSTKHHNTKKRHRKTSTSTRSGASCTKKDKDNAQSELQRKKQQRLNKETNQKKGEKPTSNIAENKEK